MSNYNHIVFDVDGTLVDNEYAILCGLYSTLLKSNIQFQADSLSFVLGIPSKDALNQLGINDPAIEKLWNKQIKEMAIPVQLFEDIEETLIKLKSLNISLGIVTSKTKQEYIDGVQDLGIDRYFDTFIFSEMTSKHKPSAEPLLKYMEMTKSKPSEILYVGDSHSDKECASNAEVDFAAIQWGSPRIKKLTGHYDLITPFDLLKVI